VILSLKESNHNKKRRETMRKIIGGILVASPFVALALLPLYTDARWLDVGIGFGASLVVILLFCLGIWFWEAKE